MIKQINTDDKNYLENIKQEDIMIKDFRKLKAYELSKELVEKILVIINRLPECEKFVLNDQLRRASYGVLSQISEGGGGQYVKREIQFFSTATASLCEVQAWLDIALINGYVSIDEHMEVENIAVQIKRLLVVYIRGLLQ